MDEWEKELDEKSKIDSETKEYHVKKLREGLERYKSPSKFKKLDPNLKKQLESDMQKVVKYTACTIANIVRRCYRHMGETCVDLIEWGRMLGLFQAYIECYKKVDAITKEQHGELHKILKYLEGYIKGTIAARVESTREKRGRGEWKNVSLSHRREKEVENGVKMYV